jgi:glycosyl transferase family 25
MNLFLENPKNKLFVINLERRKDRYEYTMNHLKKFNIDHDKINIFKAFDGTHLNNNGKKYLYYKELFFKQIEKNKIKNMSYNYNYFDYFTKGEVGCFMSHLILWKKMIDEDIENAIIFEDDCVFNESFLPTMNKVLTEDIKKIDDFLIIWIGGKMVDNYSNHMNIKITENISIKREPHPYGTFSYILSKKGATILFKYVFNRFRGNLPVDHFIDESFMNNNRKQYIVSPFLCFSQTSNDKTSIFKSNIR